MNRIFTALGVAAGVAILMTSVTAGAQTFPAKPVRIIVPYAAGGPYDDVARALGQRLTEIWGHPVVVENRGGAGGNIATEAVVRSAPDGYTLLLGNAGPITINPSLYKKLSYEPQKDLIPVTMVMSGLMVMVAHPSLPAKNVKELVALAKSRPGKMNYGSAGVGNLQHLGMEYLQSMAGIKMNHVPYKGAAPAFIDLIAGQVEVMFANIVGALPHIKTQRVRPLAVSTARRSTTLPDLPAVAETYPGFDMSTWVGIFVPAGTSRDITTKLRDDLVKVVQRQDVKERFALQGAEAVTSTPDELAAHIRRETALYAKLIKAAGVTQD